jgi:hypothetical protein
MHGRHNINIQLNQILTGNRLMKTQCFLIALTMLNLAILMIALAQHIRPTYAESAAPVLRARALEIVDERGRVGASLNVQPAVKNENGHEQIVKP